MSRPNYAAMSDPDLNPQFRREWTEPPGKRKSVPGGGRSLQSFSSNSVDKLPQESDDLQAHLRALWGLS